MQDVPRFNDIFSPINYNLSIVVKRNNRKFSGTISIEGDLKQPSNYIPLHAKDLKIKSVTYDGKSARYKTAEHDGLEIYHDNIMPGKHMLVIGFEGEITDAMHGMYPCYYKHDGKDLELIATQFESHHAREVFPCVDEPEAKATFELTLTTEIDQVVLSNMPIARQTQDSDKLVTSFQPTPRMSSYLLAWVIGDLHKKSAKTASGVEVNVWATPAQRPDGLDFALDHAVKTIEFFDEYFETPYPLPKSDHVALPDFSSGAMENWGLITYREVALLADPQTTTVASKQYIATVISHELSHQWFGNLVTMKWWNDLWLNESFATLMEYVAVDAIRPEWNAWLDYASNETIMALRRDAIDGVQPVRVPVHHPDEISTLFDGAIVYAKGARLMRMCQAYIGDEAFRKGLVGYFKEFAYHNTEADDLWRHLSATSGKDVGSFMNSWLTQSGYPVVHISPDGIRQEQFFIGPHKESSQIWPIALNSESDEDIPALLETKELKLPISNEERLNVGDRSHFITSYPEAHLNKLIARVKNGSLNELDRLQLLHEQTLLTRGGYLPSAVLIDVLKSYQNETTENVWSIIALAIGELKKFVEDDDTAEKSLKEFSRQMAQPLYDRLGWKRQPGESESDTKLRSTILSLMIYSEAEDVIAKANDIYSATTLNDVDSEIRSLVLASKVRQTDGIKLVASLFDTYQQSSSADLREDIAAGLTSVRQISQAELILSKFSNSDVIRRQDLVRWFVYMLRNKHSRSLTWQWLRDNWSWITKNFAGDKSYDDFARYAASGLVSESQLKEYKDFFEPMIEIPALKRVIELGILEIEGRVELIERDGPAVREKLSSLNIN